jgi:hypothetical protein
MAHPRHARAHAVDQREVVGVHAKHRSAAVIRHVDEIICGETVIHRHDHRAPLRNRVELLEVLMGIGGNGRHAIALADAERGERRAPGVAAVEKLRIREAQRPIDHRFAGTMDLAGTARKLQGC